MLEVNKITVCEKMIMKILWDSEKDLDLMTVTTRVNEEFGKEWKIQTVATFMKRLEKKGYIQIYRIGRYSHYHPSIEKKDFKASVVSENISFFDNGNISAFVCSLLENMELTEEDKELIRKKIDEMD